MPFIAHPAIRTRGTIGGSLAHADPAAELPAVMLALDAHVHAAAAGRARARCRRRDFFVGLFSTALEPGELLTDVDDPAHDARADGGARSTRCRAATATSRWPASPRASRVDETGAAPRARVALLSVADRPVLAEQVAQTLVGQTPSTEAIRAAAEAAADTTSIRPATSTRRAAIVVSWPRS